jgi:hypothetical protein
MLWLVWLERQVEELQGTYGFLNCIDHALLIAHFSTNSLYPS